MSNAMVDALTATVREVFGGRAASLMLHDEATDELVFTTVVGEGADRMPGRRFPSGKGIAGWVFTVGQPLVIEDVGQDPRFSAEFAETTGYVPKGIMAAPLLGPEGALGVLSVLDRPARARFSLVEVDLLAKFCNLIVLALEGDGATPREDGPTGELAAAIAVLPAHRRAAAERLVEALSGLLDEL